MTSRELLRAVALRLFKASDRMGFCPPEQDNELAAQLEEDASALRLLASRFDDEERAAIGDTVIIREGQLRFALLSRLDAPLEK